MSIEQFPDCQCIANVSITSFVIWCIDYLFNNKRVDGDQKYDQILDDIRPLVEEGYKIYVTGHR